MYTSVNFFTASRRSNHHPNKFQLGETNGIEGTDDGIEGTGRCENFIVSTVLTKVGFGSGAMA
jgi:hypothetical protein